MSQTRGLIQDDFTYAVTFLEFLYKEEFLASASGFLWEHSGRLYLISNWHTFSGREPDTGQAKSKNGGVPNRVRLSLYFKNPIPNDNVNFHIGWAEAVVPLTDDDLQNPKWFEHPVFGREVDVAVLPLPPFQPEPYVKPANKFQEFDGAIELTVAQDVFIIGYPFGKIDQAPIPIWKRATIAAEPLVNPEGKPKIYVDTATRKGMSGSLAVARFEGFGNYKRHDGSDSGTILWKGSRILGVYSGRLAPSHEMAQLGIVWKREVIDEIIAAGKHPTI